MKKEMIEEKKICLNLLEQKEEANKKIEESHVQIGNLNNQI